jgi:hypothetical protein
LFEMPKPIAVWATVEDAVNAFDEAFLTIGKSKSFVDEGLESVDMVKSSLKNHRQLSSFSASTTACDRHRSNSAPTANLQDLCSFSLRGP